MKKGITHYVSGPLTVNIDSKDEDSLALQRCLENQFEQIKKLIPNENQEMYEKVTYLSDVNLGYSGQHLIPKPLSSNFINDSFNVPVTKILFSATSDTLTKVGELNIPRITLVASMDATLTVKNKITPIVRATSLIQTTNQ